jgi:hypothetical protein
MATSSGRTDYIPADTSVLQELKMGPLYGQVCTDGGQLTPAPQTSRRSGRFGDRIPVDARYSAPVQTGPGGPLGLLYHRH